MKSPHIVTGFSRLTRPEKVKWLKQQSELSDRALETLNSHLHPDPDKQELYGDISENNISNFFLPLGLAPNFLINDQLRCIPMVIEESSVVAAASHAAKFWALNGGFNSEVKGMLKTGQVHFTWDGNQDQLQHTFSNIKESLMESVADLTARMEKRGGGIHSMEIRETSPQLPGAFQLFVKFHTANAMGANFINSVLEALARIFKSEMERKLPDQTLDIVMSILSNYTPECLVSCQVECHPSAFDQVSKDMSGQLFAESFVRAVELAQHDTYRAVTHNKGIFNGMDAVVMATGNDYRAFEAGAHAYASRGGTYASLSHAQLSPSGFSLSLELPMAIGTVGGLTSTHPMAETAMEILGLPSAEELMQIVAAAGLATNFSALRSLITTGIQEGHMKMHLGNILRQLKASAEESRQLRTAFSDRTVSFADVENFLITLRNQNKAL